ncbi:MAG: hypothetical protein EP343_28475 [Deltaproteobacteria bacterium]|nr:MAG: hypothetical protein EP343_28475 [Deltaproteobacteria bacterium]
MNAGSDWDNESEQELHASGEFFLSVSDLMSALLLIVSGLLVVALINVSIQEKRLKMSQARLETSRKKLSQLKQTLSTLMQKRQLIITRIRELETHLRAKGIDVKVTPETGEVIIKDQGIFFRGGSSRLGRRGRRFLQTFSQNYLGLVLSQRFQKSIKQVIVVGHASAVGNERYNMRLSLRRAETVAHYLATRVRLSTDKNTHKRLLRLYKKKLLVSGRGQSDASRIEHAKDRTVRFQLRFVGDAQEVERIFQKAGFSKL